MAKYLLETKGLTRHFGGLIAINNVDLEISIGNIHGIIGPNGAGKTTLLNLIAAFHQVSKGSIIFKGKEISFKTLEKIKRNNSNVIFININPDDPFNPDKNISNSNVIKSIKRNLIMLIFLVIKRVTKSIFHVIRSSKMGF